MDKKINLEKMKYLNYSEGIDDHKIHKNVEIEIDPDLNSKSGKKYSSTLESCVSNTSPRTLILFWNFFPSRTPYLIQPAY